MFMIENANFIIVTTGLSFDYSENKRIYVLLLFILWEINFAEKIIILGIKIFYTIYI